MLHKKMFNKKLAFAAPIAALSLAGSLTVNAETVNAEEMDITKELQALKAQVEALASALDEQVAAPISKTTLGGYGEIHYNSLNGTNKSGEKLANDKDQIDAHRYVLFINHEYSEDLKFYSEFELEHSLAGDGKPGEVELEQAYIEKTLDNGNRISIGQFLIPVAVLNETHEPDTFYGVERNNVENKIIPTTWWEAGAMFSGNTELFSYDVAVHSGLKAIKEGAVVGIRSGRQKVAEADGRELAATARIKASPFEGFDMAVTLQRQNDLSGTERLGIDATLATLNVGYQLNDFRATALYAKWDINDDIEDANIVTGGAGASEQEGFNVELSYRLMEEFGVFTRYSAWDNAAADDQRSAFDQVDVGVNYWLNPRVALKADYQIQTAKVDDSELKGINLGLGFSY